MHQVFPYILLFSIAMFSNGNNKPPPTLDLCTLDSKIQIYKGQRIRLSAFISEGPESSVLYDPKCQEGEPLVHFELEPNVKGKIELLRKIVKKRRYAYALMATQNTPPVARSKCPT
jgi:hypothetical protein